MGFEQVFRGCWDVCNIPIIPQSIEAVPCGSLPEKKTNVPSMIISIALHQFNFYQPQYLQVLRFVAQVPPLLKDGRLSPIKEMSFLVQDRLKSQVERINVYRTLSLDPLPLP